MQFLVRAQSEGPRPAPIPNPFHTSKPDGIRRAFSIGNPQCSIRRKIIPGACHWARSSSPKRPKPPSQPPRQKAFNSFIVICMATGETSPSRTGCRTSWLCFLTFACGLATVYRRARRSGLPRRPIARLPRSPLRIAIRTQSPLAQTGGNALHGVYEHGTVVILQFR